VILLSRIREELAKEFDAARAMGGVGVGADTFAQPPGAADEGIANDGMYGSAATGAGPMDEGIGDGFGEFVA